MPRPLLQTLTACLALSIIAAANADEDLLTPKSAETETAPAAPAPMTAKGYAIHTAASAPDDAKTQLQWYETNFGFIPNVAAVMAESPALLLAYKDTQQHLSTVGTLNPAELNTAQLAMAVENKCTYCTAGHTWVGKNFYQTPDHIMASVREKKTVSDAKLNALRDFTVAVYEERGHISDEQMQAFLDAGYTKAQALDVVACIAAKVMTNFTNALADTPIDPQLSAMPEQP